MKIKRVPLHSVALAAWIPYNARGSGEASFGPIHYLYVTHRQYE